MSTLSQGSASEATEQRGLPTPVPERGLAKQTDATPKPSSNNGSKFEATYLDIQGCH